MERIRDHWNQGLVWRQPRPLYTEFELRRGARLFAELTIPTWKRRAAARAYDRVWSLEPASWFGRRISMRDERTGHERLRLRTPLFRTAQLETAAGRRYALRSDWLGGKYVLRDEADAAVVTFDRKFRVFSIEADVTIAPAAVALPELAELVVAGWYLIVLAHARAGAAGGAAAPG